MGARQETITENKIYIIMFILDSCDDNQQLVVVVYCYIRIFHLFPWFYLQVLILTPLINNTRLQADMHAMYIRYSILNCLFP